MKWGEIPMAYEAFQYAFFVVGEIFQKMKKKTREAFSMVFGCMTTTLNEIPSNS